MPEDTGRAAALDTAEIISVALKKNSWTWMRDQRGPSGTNLATQWVRGPLKPQIFCLLTIAVSDP